MECTNIYIYIYIFEQKSQSFLAFLSEFLLPSRIDLHHCKAFCSLPLHYTFSFLLRLIRCFQSSVHSYALYAACLSAPDRGVLYADIFRNQRNLPQHSLRILDANPLAGSTRSHRLCPSLRSLGWWICIVV